MRPNYNLVETSFQKPSKPPHLGRNIQCIREAIGLKHDALGMMTKSNLEESIVYQWEQQQEIPARILQELADGLGGNVDFVRKFDEERLVYNNRSGWNTGDYLVSALERFLDEERIKNLLIDRLSRSVTALELEVEELKIIKKLK